MSEYRDYLKNSNSRIKINKKRNKQKRRRWLILICIILLAFVFYLYKEKKLNILMDDKAVETISSLAEFIKSEATGGRKLPIYCVDTSEKKIALSFDAAWGAEDFQSIMDILDKHKVKVTFFMTGAWVEDNPECVKMLVDKGHDLGNHSEHHYDMTTLSKNDMKTEIESVGKKVKDLTGYEMKLFRPPYGAYNNEVIEAVYDSGYYPIQWSVDSLDWKNYGVQSVIDTVCNHKSLEPGAIILCHNGAKYTAQALDELLTQLEGKGYELVPISKLIMTEDYNIDVTGKQVLKK